MNIQGFPDSKNLNNNNIACIERLFSSAIYKELAKNGYSILFARLLTQSNLLKSINYDHTIGELFEHAFSILKLVENRNEYTYKAVIIEKILFGKHSINTATALSEFRVSDSKADLVILNGTTTVYEIKSERDKLDKLVKQVSNYLKVFANVNIIAGAAHLEKINDLITNREVGILTLNKRNQISTIRSSISNKERISPSDVFESINRTEQLLILQTLKIDIPVEVPNTQIHQTLKGLFMQIDPVVLHDTMLHILKKTRNHIKQGEFLKLLPKSLHSLALNHPVGQIEQDNVLNALNSKITQLNKWRT